MTFQEFLVNPYDQNVGWMIWGVGAAIIAVTFGFILSVSVQRFGVALAIGSGALFVGMFVAIGFLSELSYSIDDKNCDIAENNLKAKYDIADVLWSESTADCKDQTGSRIIVILDNNNTVMNFRYKVDKETREPQLINDSGSTQVRSNDLLLERSKK